MQVISHRGYWLDKSERNLASAFQRSFDKGYGTETDVRDLAGTLVISHDMPGGKELSLDDLLDIMDGRNLPLAINIKADGLAQALKTKFEERGHQNWFTFDMSVPDMRSYLQAELPTFTRMSEVEPVPVWLDQAAGIWLDSFNGDWFDTDQLAELLHSGKQVCVVSPELHGRDPHSLWRQLRELKDAANLMICTDIPEQFNLSLKEVKP